MMSRLSIGEAIQQVVSVLSIADDTTEVLAAIARAARQMMAADEGYLLLREGGKLVLRAANGLPPELLGRSQLRVGEGLEGWVSEHGEPVAVSDARKERRFKDLPGRQSRVRSLAVVPMRLRDDIVGVLATAGPEPIPPAGSRLTGLEILAGIAAVALENEKLLLQERRRARQAELLVALASMQDPDLWPHLARVTDSIGTALGAHDTQLILLDEEGQEVVCSHDGAGGEARVPSRGEPRLLGAPWAAHILATGTPLLVEDASNAEEVASQEGIAHCGSLLAVPIQVGKERRGILKIGSRLPGSFKPQDVAFTAVLAAQVGLSVERYDLARRQLEISREEARQQARQDFLGQVSHELKTPVAVLKAYTELLMRKAELDPQRASDGDVLVRMLEQSDRMLSMIEQLLDLQKLEAGLFPLEISRFDLAQLAKRVVEGLQVAAGSHITSFRNTGPVMVMADRRRIEEVLFNLMENAIKYSPSGSTVTVTVGVDRGDGGDEGWISVADEGIGIPEKDLPRIFDRFYQGEGRFLRGHVGLGLGVYIAREIVERHSGRLWVDSVLEKGSTFHLALPLASGGQED